MSRYSVKELEMAAQKIKKGGVGVVPTDTIYGLVGSAFSKKAVSRIFKLKKRDTKKPLIVLIASTKDLALFRVKTTREQKNVLQKVWPGKVSVVMPVPHKKFLYLHRGTNAIAFRVPHNKTMQALLVRTGPLVAPSANIEGGEPAKTKTEAYKVFGDAADFYIAGGRKDGQPSTLVAFDTHGLRVLRKGAVEIAA